MKTYVIALAVLIGVLGGFYGGYKVGQNNVSASSNSGGTRASNTGGSSLNAGGRGFGAGCPSPGATPPPTGSQGLARGPVTNPSGASLPVTHANCDDKRPIDPAAITHS